MGVRGLTTYIKTNEKKFLKLHKLHNCTILLDGNSIAANLFIWSSIESAFGGDYDKFAKYVKEFFKLLQKCKIKPFVLFDGGYEQRKLKTVYSRLREKFRTACQAQPFTGSLNFPLFMRIVFREVMVELNIPFAQSDFEADDELAALARQLKCPVMSYDSDFYIYDILYIPLPSLNLIPVEFNKSDCQDVGPKYYLECKIYSVDVFIESFGGLDRNMLPLLAALLGNDYIKRSVFKKFYTNLKIPKGKTNHLQRRIKAVIEWLRHETFETAVHKILCRMRKNHRRFVKRQLKRIVQGYVQCESILSEYLGLELDTKSTESFSVLPDSSLSKVDSSMVNIIERINVDSIEEETLADVDNNDVSSSSEEDSCEESDADDSPEGDYNAANLIENDSVNEVCSSVTICNGNSTNVPYWLLDFARKGKIQSCVFDILTLQQYFFLPQVEDFTLPPSHLISLKLLNAIVGLLQGENGNLVKYWTRNGSQLCSYNVEPITATPTSQFPQCERIPDISQDIRKALILEVAEADLDLTSVPEDWHLFLIALVFWLKNMKQPAPSEAYLHTMVMCLVGIYTVDSSIGVYRNRQTFMRKYRNFLNKVVEARSREKPKLKDSNEESKIENEIESSDLSNQLKSVSSEDCVLIIETILPYHHVSEQVKMKPKLFCLSTVHAFAQFQSSLLHLMILNSILGYPLKDCFVSKLFSGTFVYNVFQNFSKRNNIGLYVETLLRTSPSLLKLYKSLVCYLQKYLNSVALIENPTKSRRKKKKDNKRLKLEQSHERRPEEEESSEMFIDDNNRFSGLCLEET
ncbi:protein asteroid-like [Macrosteles quadrilineatus]|uniref:protein asteroid-like n=1 Tax=Macrosteles quadrilineatus TaxID=74068 RepID=UPI0023E12C2B|nr:protein asteroid-like [Macrosteles quadrilineatus]XP_054281711.1 protein asteroid-like [Macrosteles quadrilineatus]XP_054281712.1 protein asteroid-like [Macrosteles quadrilineatus]XP_054281713.1 protein asteroid-like [Macrosteles quadrilineatus]XP_054281714.1 protein asteroid-like [Macrosteles quadrilineatus]